MKVAVVGLFHLGCVTSACLAHAGHDVVAFDPDAALIANLQSGKPPIFEPGLEDLLKASVNNKKLIYTNKKEALADADIVWITFDTPVDDNDHADVKFVRAQIESLFSVVKQNALILISSQLPAGSSNLLREHCDKLYPHKNIRFAYSPENLRLGKAIEIFTHPDRIVVGVQAASDKERLQTLLAPFSNNIIWMSLASAEMTKHALNAFLANSVVFINEIAMLCEHYGADASEVEKGLKSEDRIGKKAYLKPGNAIAGGTLARDVNYLVRMGHEAKLATPLFSAILTSNAAHKTWALRRLKETFSTLNNVTIATLGLTYKAGTNTLRRSSAVETCAWLSAEGANVLAFDPAISQLPDELAAIIQLKPSIEQALQNADAVVITTEWPEFNHLTAETLLTHVKQPLVFDATGFLFKSLGQDQRIRYFSVGKQL